MKSREGASLAGLSLWELLCILAHDILPNPSLQKKIWKNSINKIRNNFKSGDLVSKKTVRIV